MEISVSLLQRLTEIWWFSSTKEFYGAAALLLKFKMGNPRDRVNRGAHQSFCLTRCSQFFSEQSCRYLFYYSRILLVPKSLPASLYNQEKKGRKKILNSFLVTRNLSWVEASFKCLELVNLTTQIQTNCVQIQTKSQLYNLSWILLNFLVACDARQRGKGKHCPQN